jgi:hypothetical protein
MPGVMIGIWLAIAVVSKRRPYIRNRDWRESACLALGWHTFNHSRETRSKTPSSFNNKTPIFTTKTLRHKDFTKVEPSDYDTMYSLRLCVSVVNIIQAMSRIDRYSL